MPAEVLAIFDRLRQPDNLSRKNALFALNHSLAVEIHGFASLPRGRFAIIVCNRRLIKINVAGLPWKAPAAVTLNNF
jgi:hypothetical protein